MKNRDDFDSRGTTVDDHVLIDGEKENIFCGQVWAAMAFTRKVGQLFEGCNEFFLNAIGNLEAGFSEEVAPDLPEVIFGFRGDDVRFHGSGWSVR